MAATGPRASLGGMTHARASSPAELAVLIPYLLGFHPQRSLVLAAVRRGRLGVIQRLDLPSEDLDVTAAARQLVAHAHRDGADLGVVIAYEQTADEALPLVGEVQRLCQATLGRASALVVREGRYFPPDPHAGPGTPLPDPERVPAVAHLVLEGRSPLAQRADVAARVVPGCGARADEVSGLLARDAAGGDPGAAEPDDARAEAWADLLSSPRDARRPGPTVTARTLAVVIRSVEDVRWRDALLAALCPTVHGQEVLADLPIEAARAAVSRCGWVGEVQKGTDVRDADLLTVRAATERLLGVLPDVPPEHSSPLLTVVGHLAWWSGDGALASCALQEALRHRPGYRLAGLLLMMVEHGLQLPAA